MGRAVPDYQQLARYLAHKVFEKAHHVFCLEGSILLDHVELALKGDGAHCREVIAREPLMEHKRLSYRSIGADRHRQQVEVRLIGKHYRPALREGPLSALASVVLSIARWPLHRAGRPDVGAFAKRA